MKNITLKQIAKELGLSISTISKALNNSSEISQETRDKVQAFAKLYNYKPNMLAQNLRQNKSKTIGVIIPEIIHHYFSEVISGIESVANAAGYQVMIGVSNESTSKERLQLDMFIKHHVDGLIISLAKETQKSEDYSHIQELLQNNVPMVMFDRVLEGFPCDKVVVDDFNGAKRAVKYLIESGSQNIALITTEDSLSVGTLRKNGYLRALEEKNLPINQDLILRIENHLYGEDFKEEFNQKVQQFLINNPKIDAIFAVNELFAIKAISALRKQNKQVPNQVKIIGFTDGVLSRNSTPTLTTVRQHGILVGENAARKLLDRIEDAELSNYETIIIKTDLIERESTIQKNV